MKTTCKKSWPVKLLQVSGLTFDPCFNVRWGHHNKPLYISFTLVLGLGTGVGLDNHCGSGLVICVSMPEKLLLHNTGHSKLTDAFLLLLEILTS